MLPSICSILRVKKKKIQEAYLSVWCVPGTFFMLSNRIKLELLPSAPGNANQKTFFFRQPSLEVSWFLAVSRGRGWRGEKAPWESSAELQLPSISLRAIKESISDAQKQVQRQRSKSAFGALVEARWEGRGRRTVFASLPLVSFQNPKHLPVDLSGMWNQAISS